ncbi:hypothetical protein J5N97_017258 [Dioscorea zingiberensis]|uniref:Ribosomal protein L34Ae n=1 Tax=Dioscorea zingiberensis TaxID=325984 RepID=A0A9D5CMW7_9LILI|nr:hypothetical protein J5N97_017258 [Dioscorea zingiberensis]
MDLRRVSMYNTHWGLVMKGSLDDILYRKMALVITSFWFHFTASLFFLIGLIVKHVFRINRESGSQGRDSDLQSEIEVFELKELKEKDCSDFEKEEASNFCFKFEYQVSDDGLSSNEELAVPRGKENKSSVITKVRKYQFLSEKDFSCFFEEPQVKTFHVRESFFHSDSESSDGKLQSKLSSSTTTAAEVSDDLQQHKMEALLRELKLKFSSGNSNNSEELEDAMFFNKQKTYNSETSSIGGRESADGTKFLSEEFSGFDSDSESSTSDGYSVKNLIVDSDSDGFLSEIDFGGYECESDVNESTMDSKVVPLYAKVNRDSYVEKDFKDYDDLILKEDLQKTEGTILQFAHSFDGELFQLGIGLGGRSSCSSSKTPPTDHSIHSDELWSDDESCDHLIQLKELKGQFEGARLELIDSPDNEVPSFRNGENSSIDDALETKKENSQVDLNVVAHKADDHEMKKLEQSAEKSEESHSKDLDDEDFDELESLWEHQDLIEQLRTELRKARATGLPTIFEESESPKTIEVPKPKKIDKEFLREDPIDELHKFYKSYRERMRKFDILNYQKMYAIGFLQLKDPLDSLASQKPLIPTMTSLLFQNLWPFRHQKCCNDLTKKFIKELQSDLETVYVGQTCLSWEFLRWQYEKARELPESDPYWSHQYNQVAGEFQQFQVLIHRFLENESFQGPRLSNYVKNRCVLRNLLQVPVIKEDCTKGKIEEQKRGTHAITCELLEDIMEESIRVLWEFIKAEKDETPVILKVLMGSQVELQDPSDSEIMVDAQAILQKKEKKLKDILRTGNCIVKKFRKPREDRSNQELFFSQVDMKLVSRVLKMSRLTTDQLLWCHKKLSKITFYERKVHREPSFLLFPC